MRGPMFRRPFLLALFVASVFCVPESIKGQAKKSGSPEENPPKNVVRLTAFGACGLPR